MCLPTGRRLTGTVFFLMALTLQSLDAVADEEHHKHEQHRHLQYADMKNPVELNAQSMAKGKTLYEKHCIACHGEAGKGGIGPDLTGAARKHGSTDGEVFHVITDGVQGTAMRGFGGDLSEELRWHLVNYIRSLRKTMNLK